MLSSAFWRSLRVSVTVAEDPLIGRSTFCGTGRRGQGLMEELDDLSSTTRIVLLIATMISDSQEKGFGCQKLLEDHYTNRRFVRRVKPRTGAFSMTCVCVLVVSCLHIISTHNHLLSIINIDQTLKMLLCRLWCSCHVIAGSVPTAARAGHNLQRAVVLQSPKSLFCHRLDEARACVLVFHFTVIVSCCRIVVASATRPLGRPQKGASSV